MQTIGESIIHNQHCEPAYIFIHSHSKFKHVTAFLWGKKKEFRVTRNTKEKTWSSFNTKKWYNFFLHFHRWHELFGFVFWIYKSFSCLINEECNLTLNTGVIFCNSCTTSVFVKYSFLTLKCWKTIFLQWNYLTQDNSMTGIHIDKTHENEFPININVSVHKYEHNILTVCFRPF